MRAAASHTAALAGSYDAYRAMFERYGVIEGGDIAEMVDIAAGFVAFGNRLPAASGSASARARAVAGAGWRTLVSPPASRCRRWMRRRASASTCICRPMALAKSCRRHGTGRLQGRLRRLGGPHSAFADGRRRHRGRDQPLAGNLERQRESLARLAESATKPVLLWSYTLPAPRSVEIASEAGLPLFTDIRNCARTCARWPTIGRCESAFCGRPKFDDGAHA